MTPKTAVLGTQENHTSRVQPRVWRTLPERTPRPEREPQNLRNRKLGPNRVYPNAKPAQLWAQQEAQEAVPVPTPTLTRNPHVISILAEPAQELCL